MTIPVVAVAYSLLNLVASISAQGLDPIKNMCFRFDHQCNMFLLTFKSLAVADTS